ncbi:MAG: mannose-1-phosphate guanylyltransferase [Nocardioides sp.]|uniref:mannose-1-phosphate guanylyltransferase n=1 Tax=Nocardioides sp. TaxID=35761 RepID=UPI0039E55003
MDGIDHFWAVVPAGGAGTRLWPLSRQAEPKFLLDLTGAGRSLLQATVDRLQPLVDDRVLVVTGQGHRDAVRAQLPTLRASAVLAEPAPRDSMAAIGWAAATIEAIDPDAVMGSFAADHVIGDVEEFGACVRRAVAAARDDWLVTIGIEPTGPATGFGYIEQGPDLADHPGVHMVVRFVEKPSAQVAADYVASGRFRWNAGMFVARPRVLLDLLAVHHSEFAAALRRLASAPEMLASLWPMLPRIAVDHAVAEPAAEAGRVAVVPAGFEWDDIGDFASLHALLGANGQGVTVLGDRDHVQTVDASGLVVTHPDRLVAVVGLDDVVVVDTGDALLVTTTARAQEVKAVVERLRAQGRAELT